MNNLIETERLLLRPTTTTDALFIYQLMNMPKWLKYIGDRKIRSEHNASEYIKEKMMPQQKRLGYSNYTVIRKSDLEKLGTCGLYDREGFEAIDIGFAFLPEYEGQGYAYEAASKLIQVAREAFDVQIIDAITTKDNIASQKLLKKLGLVMIGNISLPNDNEKLLHYRIKKEDIPFVN
jgi:RimJ/RimL family protein N-acetyltransferase